MKTCIACGIEQALGNFHSAFNNRLGTDKRNSRCKPCRSAWRKASPSEQAANAKLNVDRRARYKVDPAYRAQVREGNLRQFYGLTIAAFDAMVEAQGGKCMICQTTDPGKKTWAVDHDHSCCPTNKTCGACIRGLLCGRCNTGLGMFGDSPALLLAAADYLAGMTASGSPSLGASIVRKQPVA